MWKVRKERKEEKSPTAGDVRTIDPRSQGELSTAALQPRPIAKQMVDWLINQRIVTFLEIRIFCKWPMKKMTSVNISMAFIYRATFHRLIHFTFLRKAKTLKSWFVPAWQVDIRFWTFPRCDRRWPPPSEELCRKSLSAVPSQIEAPRSCSKSRAGCKTDHSRGPLKETQVLYSHLS